MGLPGVNIIVTNGNLGRVAGTVDSISGLLLSGVAVSGKLVLATPYQIFTLADANDLGLDADYDVTNSTDAYRQIQDFYSAADPGTQLWIMVVANTVTMTQMADVANNYAKLLLEAAQGTIRLLGITRSPAGAYSPTITEGIDPDVVAALPKAHALAEQFAGIFAPLVVLIEGRAFTGVVADLHNFRQDAYNSVGVVLAGLGASPKKAAAVGLALGRMASVPVQRNIGRVKDGDVGLTNAYLSDGTLVTSKNIGYLTSLHDKGAIFLRKYQNLNGFYWNDDPSASPLSDDYSSLARRRVINKAIIITYQTYVDEILDDVEIDEGGRLEAAVAKSYQAKIERAISLQMQVNGEISGVSATIDPAQDVLSTDKIRIVLSIRPKGYSKNIEVELGFINPNNNG